MTEFLNYTVDLYLKDGSVSSGQIVSVDGTKIQLSDVSESKAPGQKLPTLEILNSSVNDLKVTKLPPDFVKNLKKSKAKKEKVTKKEKKDESDVSGKNSDSEIKMTEDFDFAANLAMFDKKSVFENFQKKDTIKPEQRLVGHNKVENFRKDYEKFRNDEMVLDSTRTDDWDSIGISDRKETLRNASVTGRLTPVHDVTGGSSNKNYTLTNVSTGNSVPVCSPIQLLDIERISGEAFALTPEVMAEIFSTNLSQYITQHILGGSGRLNPNNHNLPPLVVLLIGSERCSIRALAVGRHLTNHGVRVLAFLVNHEMVDASYLKQKSSFEQAGGKILSTSVPELLHVLNHQLDTPVELIIDALQGYDDHLEDIFFEQKEQQLIKQLITWCNEPRQRGKVMSFDIPSGIDGGSGTITDADLVISSHWCVSMGLPVAGILHAYRNEILRVDAESETLHLLVDIGIPNKVYSRKPNLRRFDRVWYGAESVVKLQPVEKLE
ncbi:enhancer of mRNA decapping [Yamadazyma tenuis]|uniref:Enhancer of mRNA-decapping protein 3 n=1 Tax=Candida tenuis (strain ATCC 10573 / BCRC 21748 / CBS 615 / JCM 9827 / NBRC 10315 / NRRL Y-1498 / VKM Y-70) TaxID=590646 RepID=G3B2K9_CANTC|nr:YjeF N-terminal domain-like protein [Yamadazyma tenuis ATCC 10573]EGV64703.1 YjeF N-terminal domain-like protein [Yamadazyma tenuis ATCC 10573]WEJ97490.1 enhancer of mRNA decapping [Yamadazyma tenuis]